MLFKEKFLGKNISRRRILSHTNKQNDKGQTIPMFSVKKDEGKQEKARQAGNGHSDSNATCSSAAELDVTTLLNTIWAERR